MVRLERYSETRSELSGVKGYAYKKAQSYLKNVFDPHNLHQGPMRYKETVSLYEGPGVPGEKGSAANYRANVMIQRARIQEINKFLDAVSSTIGRSRLQPEKKGLLDVIDKRTQTINDRLISSYGSEYELSRDDLKRFFDSKKQAKLEAEVGSDLMFVVASIIKKNKLKTNKKDFNKFLQEHIDIKDAKEKKDLIKDHLVDGKKENFNQKLERLNEFINFANDPILDQMVKKSLKAGINVDNIFI